MKKVNNSKNNQTHQFSAIFFQIGIVFSLFLVYTALEFKVEQKPFAKMLDYEPQRVLSWDELIPNFEKEKPKKEVEIQKKVHKNTDVFEKKDDEVKETIVKVIEPQEPTSEDFLNSFEEADEPEPIEVDNTIYKATLYAPVFRGCEGLDETLKKTCFQAKMQKFVERKFDTGIADELGLSSGLKRIYIYFVINKQGEIENTKIRAPHPKLSKEGKRMINLLPKFKPALKDGKPIKVEYVLPIAFKVE